MISYDPDKTPNVPPELFEEAEQLGLRIVQVLCDERDAKVGDVTAVSFFALVPFLPHAGDRIELVDGTNCEVKRTYWKLVQRHDQQGKLRYASLIPNVIAHKVD